jgi:small conductance mechanosensitive channel
MDIHIVYNKAFNWLLDHGPKLIFGIIVFFIGLWVIKVLKNTLKHRMSRKQVHSSLQPFFLSLSITALYIVLIVLVLGIIGIQPTFFTTIVGAATVAAGLALSGTLQNFAGGIMILLLKPFELDDNIMTQGQEGIVTSIQIFYTTIITFDNKTVIVPNGKLFNEVIINLTREGKRRLDIEFKLSYNVSAEQVREVVGNSVKSTKNVLVEPAMYMGIVSLDPDGIKYTLRVWVDPKNFLHAKLDLQEYIVKDLIAAGIKFPGMA